MTRPDGADTDAQPDLAAVEPQPYPPPAVAPPPHHPAPRPPSRPAFSLRDAASALGLAGVLAVLGLPVGVVWALTSPRVELMRTELGFGYVQENPEEYVAADAIFSMIGIGLGIAVAITVWFAMRRRRGPLTAFGLAAGSIACQTVAWRFGRIGREDYEASIERMHVGWRFWRSHELLMVDFNPAEAYAELTKGHIAGMFDHLALGVLATMAFAAVFTYTVCAGWSKYASLSREDEEPETADGPSRGYAPYVVSPTSAPVSRNADDDGADGRLSS
ncbi:MAG: hypothetical protein ACRDXX_19680 [Stackebrandtia sp.]